MEPVKNPHHRGARQDERDQEAGRRSHNPRIHGSPPCEVRLDFSLRARPVPFEGTSSRFCASEHLDSLRNSSSPDQGYPLGQRGPVRNVPKANLFRTHPNLSAAPTLRTPAIHWSMILGSSSFSLADARRPTKREPFMGRPRMVSGLLRQSLDGSPLATEAVMACPRRAASRLHKTAVRRRASRPNCPAPKSC